MHVYGTRANRGKEERLNYGDARYMQNDTTPFNSQISTAGFEDESVFSCSFTQSPDSACGEAVSINGPGPDLIPRYRLE